MGQRVWTKEKIVAVIRSMADQGHSLAAKKTRLVDSGLFGSASYHFGSWRKAVEAAGYDYEAILTKSKEETLAKRRPKGYWDVPKIIAAIQERAREGKPLNSLAVQLEDGGLVASACRLLGSWEHAVETATGIPYEKIRLNHDWSREEIIETIKERYAQGKTLHGRTVLQEHPALYSSARVFFGTWRQAIEAAGLEYLGVGTTWQWDKERLAEALHEWALGDEVGLPRRLQTAVRRIYGSWAEALKAVGLDPAIADQKALRKPWSRKKVSQEIRRRVKRGESLLYSDVRRDDIRLVQAAIRHYGSWVKARCAILGLAPRVIRRWPPR